MLGGAHGLDHADALAGEARVDVAAAVAVGGGHDRACDRALKGHGQRLLALPRPIVGPLAADDARRLAGDRTGDGGALLGGIDNRLLLEAEDVGLLGGEEGGADPSALGTQHHRRGNAAPIDDAACAQHRRIAHRIHHLGNEGEGADGRVVAAAVVALGDDDIET